MSIYDLTKEELENYFIAHGEKKFHADQLFSWLYEKKIKSFSEITNIKQDFLEVLKKDFSIDMLKIVKKESDVDVSKYLFLLEDGM